MSFFFGNKVVDPNNPDCNPEEEKEVKPPPKKKEVKVDIMAELKNKILERQKKKDGPVEETKEKQENTTEPSSVGKMNMQDLIKLQNSKNTVETHENEGTETKVTTEPPKKIQQIKETC